MFTLSNCKKKNLSFLEIKVGTGKVQWQECYQATVPDILYLDIKH